MAKLRAVPAVSRRLHLSVSAAVFSALLILVPGLRAQSVWTGSSGGNWSTGSNWQGGSAPANNGTATVQTTGGNTAIYAGDTAQVDTAWSIAGLVNGQTGYFTLSGSTLTIGSGGISLSSGANAIRALDIQNAIVLSSNQTWAGGNYLPAFGLVVNDQLYYPYLDSLGILGPVNLAGHTLTVSGGVHFEGNIALNSGTLSLGSGNNAWTRDTDDDSYYGVAQAASLSGTGTLNVTAGDWRFAGGSFGFTGAVNVSGGALTLSSLAAGGSHAVTIGSGATLNTDDTLGISTLTGTGNFRLSGGTLSSATLDTWTGTTYIQGGTLNAVSGYTNSLTLNLSSGAITGSVANSGTMNVSGGNLSADLTNTASLTVSGGTVSGGLTNSGTVSMSAGTVTGSVTNTGNFSMTGGAISGSTTNSGTFQLQNGSIGNLTLNGGVFTQTGGAILGTVAVNAGTFQPTGSTLASLGNVTNNDTFVIYNLPGTNSLYETGVTYSGIMSGSGTLTKTGPGYAILSGANTFTGQTTISSGRLVVAHSLALQNSTVVLDGGQLLFASPGWATSANPYTATLYTVTGPYVTSATLGGLTGGGSLSLDLPPAYLAITNQVGVTLSVGNNNRDTVYSGAISGSETAVWWSATLYSSPGSLTKIGTGTLTLTGTSNYYGGTTISAGTLQLGDGGTTGSITGNVTNNATLAFNRSDAVTFAGAISGTGAVTKAGAGTLTLTGTNTYSGGTTITGGLVEFSALGNLGSGNLTLNGGGLKWASGTATDVSARLNSTLGSGGATFDTNGNNVTLSNALTGTGGLTKQGSGTLTLTSAGTFTGGTTVSAGTLALGHALTLQNSTVSLSGGALDFGNLTSATFGSLSGSSNLTLANTTSAAVALTTGGNHASTTFSGVLSGAGSLVKTGNGTLALSGNNTFTGTTTVSAGTLQIGAGGTTGSLAGNVTNNAALVFNRSDALAYAGTIGGTGSLTQSGSGTLTLSGANTFSGGATLSSGTVIAGSNSALGSGTVALQGASLRAGTGGASLANALVLGADTTLGGTNALTLSGALTLGGFRTLNVTNSALTTLSGTIGETSPSILIKQGSGELSVTGANTYSGGTFIQAGTVRINNSTGSAFGTGAVTVASGATLAGSGSFSGALQLNGTYAPGNSPGTASTGSQTWAGGATYLWEINDATGSAGHNPGWDWMNIAGALTITATNVNPFTIDVSSLTLGNVAGLAANFDANQNHTYLIATASSGISGFSADKFTLDTADFANTTSGTWSLSQSGNDLSLVYTTSAVPEPSTYAALAGLAALGFVAWRRRRG